MTKTISFLIPLFNEEKRIYKSISALKNADIPQNLRLEKIIFVNDGSTDSTLELLLKNKDWLEEATGAVIEIISYPKNRGKGYAIKTGMAYSYSDYTLFFDADMATPLSELSKFEPFMTESKDVIVGTRKNGKSTVIRHQPKLRETLGRVYTLLSQVILNTWVTDFTCGFKAFSRRARIDIFSRAKINGWGYDSEVLYLGRKMGYELTEKAVMWSDDRNTRVKLTTAIFGSFAELLRIRFNDLVGIYNVGSALRERATKIEVATN